MPDTSVSQPSIHKNNARPAETAAKLAGQVEQSFDHAADLARDKTRELRDDVRAGAAAAPDRAASLQQDTKSAVKHAAERVEDVARGAAASAQHTIEKVRDESSALLHDARDLAVESYDSARDYAVETAHEASKLAQRAGNQTVRHAQRASLATGRFVSTHALPLTFVGASVGWLAWSIRRDARRAQVRDVYVETLPASPARLHGENSARRPQMRSPEVAPRSAPTTTGNKLMGVRVRDLDYDR